MFDRSVIDISTEWDGIYVSNKTRQRPLTNVEWLIEPQTRMIDI